MVGKVVAVQVDRAIPGDESDSGYPIPCFLSDSYFIANFVPFFFDDLMILPSMITKKDYTVRSLSATSVQAQNNAHKKQSLSSKKLFL
jgi:hypothetical protein